MWIQTRGCFVMDPIKYQMKNRVAQWVRTGTSGVLTSNLGQSVPQVMEVVNFLDSRCFFYWG
jgi:hypothetical protein